LFSIRNSAGAQADGFPQHALERLCLALRGPYLELGIARRVQLDEILLAAVVQLDAGHRLCVAAIERFGKPQNGGERADDAALLAAERAVVVVRPLRRRLAVVTRDETDDLGFYRLEPAQVAVLDQVVRVLVVALIADVRADVVQERRKVQPLALAIGQAVDAARLIEDRQREARHLIRMLGPVAAAFGQLDDAAPPHVGILAGLRDVLPVVLDVIENQALA
jgi:hypothetical protein